MKSLVVPIMLVISFSVQAERFHCLTDGNNITGSVLDLNRTKFYLDIEGETAKVTIDDSKDYPSKTLPYFLNYIDNYYSNLIYGFTLDEGSVIETQDRDTRLLSLPRKDIWFNYKHDRVEEYVERLEKESYVLRMTNNSSYTKYRYNLRSIDSNVNYTCILESSEMPCSAMEEELALLLVSPAKSCLDDNNTRYTRVNVGKLRYMRNEKSKMLLSISNGFNSTVGTELSWDIDPEQMSRAAASKYCSSHNARLPTIADLANNKNILWMLSWTGNKDKAWEKERLRFIWTDEQKEGEGFYQYYDLNKELFGFGPSSTEAAVVCVMP